MLDWKNYRLKLKNRIGAFGKLQPKTLQGYQSLNQAGEDSPLDLKTPRTDCAGGGGDDPLRWLYYRARGIGNQGRLYPRRDCRGIGRRRGDECRCGDGLFGARTRCL